MSWHECDPWVAAIRECPMGHLDEETEKKRERVTAPDRERARESASAAVGVGVGAAKYRPAPRELYTNIMPVEEAETAFAVAKEVQDEWGEGSRIPDTWRDLSVSAVAVGAAALMTQQHMARAAALKTAELHYPGYMVEQAGKSGVRARRGSGTPGYLVNYQSKLRNMIGITQKKKLWPTSQRVSSDPSQDPDVPGSGSAVQDFGEWYYQVFTKEMTGATRRGPSHINPEDPQWAELWGAFWSWSWTPFTRGARPPGPGETAPGFWEDDPSVFESEQEQNSQSDEMGASDA